MVDSDDQDSPDAPRPLTPREVEVVRLIAQGLSNAEIAARLHVGRRTVVTHIEHVFGKLRLRSRGKVALWALRTGLVPLQGLEQGSEEPRTGADKRAGAVPEIGRDSDAGFHGVPVS